MVLYRNGLFLNAIVSTIILFFKAILRLIKVLHLTAAVGLFLLGLLLYFTGAFETYPPAKIAFYVLFSISLLYALIATVNRSFAPAKKKKRKARSVQIINAEPKRKDAEKIFEEQPKYEPEKIYDLPEETSVYPKYYAVKGKPGYYFAEYEYEAILYKKTEKGFVLIRKDRIKR